MKNTNKNKEEINNNKIIGDLNKNKKLPEFNKIITGHRKPWYRRKNNIIIMCAILSVAILTTVTAGVYLAVISISSPTTTPDAALILPPTLTPELLVEKIKIFNAKSLNKKINI